MTFVSVAQAAQCLGIDAKTLRRWLVQAQLLLQDHPGDGRKKGVSSEHLELLAHLHQRRLAPLSPAIPAPAPSESPPLPAAWLSLPEMLGTVQAQLIALQQHVAELTRLLQQHPPLAAPAQPTRRTANPAPTAPHARPTTSTTVRPRRKPVPVIPRVEYRNAGCYVVVCAQHGVLPLEPDTPAWFAWLARQSSFRFVGRSGHFTAHHEWRVPKGAWRAHRHIRNHSHSLRLAPTQALTIAVLEQAAAALQAHLT